VLVTAAAGMALALPPASRAADPCPNAPFRTGLSAKLPACRAFEKITPADKGNGDVGYGVAFDADRVFATATQAFLPDTPFFHGVEYFFATRSAGGWDLREASAAPNAITVAVNDAYSQTIIRQSGPDLLPEDTDGTDDVYARTDQGLEWLSRGSLGGNSGDDATFAGQSADGSHVLFETAESLESEDAGRTSGVQLYERTGGQTRVVGVDSNENLIGDAGAVLGDGESVHNHCAADSGDFGAGADYPISADGSTIFFCAAGSGQLYARVDGQNTVHVSASQCERALPDPPCGPPAPTRFQGASRDGSRVLFSTEAQLTDGDLDEAADLYSYDLHSASLIRLSGGPGDDQALGFTGVATVSDDALRIYFSGPPEEGLYPIYLFDGHSGSVTRIADREDRLYTQSRIAPQFFASSTPDGGTFLFQSSEQLTSYATPPVCDSTVSSGEIVPGPCTEVYRYRVVADEIDCVSCNPSGALPSSPPFPGGQAGAIDGALFNGSSLVGRQTTVISNDGSVVAFEAGDALVPRDTNGRIDVYEWRDGEVFLLTSGIGDYDSKLLGISPDARSIFISTVDRLVPTDTDSLADLYSARVGGGLAADHPPGSVAPCMGDACQGQPTAPSRKSDAATGNLQAPRTVEAVRPRIALLALPLRQRMSLAHGARVAVRVRVSGPGRVSAFASARLGGRSVTVARGSSRVRRSGTARVSMRLSRAARTRLDRTGRLRLRLVARFQSRSASRVLDLRLGRRAGTGGR
jgi:hypothetical protein